MRKQILVILLLSTSITYCTEPAKKIQAQILESSSGIQINIDVDKEVKESWPIEEILDSISFVQLELDLEKPIGKIDKAYITKEEIIVVDKQNAQTLFIYDKNGSLIKALSVSGRGPGEFSDIQDAAYDPFDKTIDVYDRAQKKILIYSLNGDFIREVNIPYYFMYFEVTGKDTYTFHNDEEDIYKGEAIQNYIIIANKSGEIIMKYLPFVHEGRILSFFKQFSTIGQSKNGASFVFSLSNNIYYSKGTKFHSAYSIDYGKYTLPLEEYPYTNEQTQAVFNSNYVFTMMNFAETEEQIYYMAAQYRKPIHIIHNKENQETLLFRKVGTPYETFSFAPVVGVTDHALISFRYPGKLKDLPLNSAPSSRIHYDINKLHHWSEQASDLDNPALVLFHLKK